MIDFFSKSINEKQRKVLRIYRNLAAINYKGECIKPCNYGSVMYPQSHLTDLILKVVEIVLAWGNLCLQYFSHLVNVSYRNITSEYLKTAWHVKALAL